MIRSMTGFASGTGALAPHSWSWDLRSVNGKGLDIRVRVPDWLTGFEAAARKMLAAQVGRGNVTLGLRLVREETGGSLGVNDAQLDDILAALSTIEMRAMEAGVTLAPSRPADIASMRGVLEQVAVEDDNDALIDALTSELCDLINDFNGMRQKEGAAVSKVLMGQLNEIDELINAAADQVVARAPAMAEVLKRNLARIMDEASEIDPDRVAQELALIAVKSDVTEEIDRLRAHVEAARDLLTSSAPVGRKLDFLMQEFNREANTLCSKSQDTALTQTGLALKTVIDQMREQVQNVE